MCGRRGAVLPSPPWELCSSNIPWEWWIFFTFRGPASPSVAVQSIPTYVRDPPPVSQEFILFTISLLADWMPVCADLCHRRCLYMCALGSADGWHTFQHATETMIDTALHAQVPTTALRGGNFLSDFIILKKKKKHYCKIVRPLAASLPSFPVLSMLCACVCVDSRACLLCHRLPKLQPQECKITSTREISCL